MWQSSIGDDALPWFIVHPNEVNDTIHVVGSWDERVNADGGLSWESLCQRHSPSPLNISLHQPAELNSGRGFSRTPSLWRAGVLSTTWWPCIGFFDGWITKNSSMLTYCSMSLQYTVFCMHWILWWDKYNINKLYLLKCKVVSVQLV